MPSAVRSTGYKGSTATATIAIINHPHSTETVCTILAHHVCKGSDSPVSTNFNLGRELHHEGGLGCCCCSFLRQQHCSIRMVADSVPLVPCHLQGCRLFYLSHGTICTGTTSCSNATTASECGTAGGTFCAYACEWNQSACVNVWDRCIQHPSIPFLNISEPEPLESHACPSYATEGCCLATDIHAQAMIRSSNWPEHQHH